VPLAVKINHATKRNHTKIRSHVPKGLGGRSYYKVDVAFRPCDVPPGLIAVTRDATRDGYK